MADALSVVPYGHPNGRSGDQPGDLIQVIDTCLSGLAQNTRRVYASHIARFLDWSHRAPGALSRESIKQYLRTRELAGDSAQVRNQALAALKRLAYEAGELGYLDSSIAAQIARIKAWKIKGIRSGRWLNAAQVRALLSAPDRTTTVGLRDRAILALMCGAGLRRAELCSLDCAQVRTIDTVTVLVDIQGKGGRVRSVRIPAWCAQTVNVWIDQLKK